MERFIGNLSPVTCADGATTDIQILKTGNFRKGGRNIKVGLAELQRAVDNFNAKVAGEPPLDYDHSFDYGGTSEASGWYQRLFVKDGALWATVEFTQDAVEKIKAKKFRFFSPTFSTDWPDESGKKHGFTILAGALTNRPFLKNMAPISLADQFTEEDIADLASEFDPQNDFASLLSERGREMGIFKGDPQADKATIESLTEQVENLTAEAGKVEALTEQVNTLTAERDDFKSKLETAESGKTDAEREVTKLSERVEDLEKTAFTTERDRLIRDARSKGKLDATDETTTKWHDRAEKLGLETVKELLSEIKPGAAVPLSELGHGDNGSSGFFDEESRLNTLHERAEKIAADQGIPYGEAAVIAEKELA